MDDPGTRLPAYLNSARLKPFISNALAVALTSPILYEIDRPKGVRRGTPATALPDICDVWVRAKAAGALLKQQHHIADQAYPYVSVRVNPASRRRLGRGEEGKLSPKNRRVFRQICVYLA